MQCSREYSLEQNIISLLFVLFVELGTVSFNKGDEDLINNQINITKTYYRTDRQDVITEPKTKKSVRVVEIPEFLSKEIKEFVDGLYGMPDDERLFPIVQEAVQHKMKNYIKKAVQTVTLERDNLLKQLLQSQKLFQEQRKEWKGKNRYRCRTSRWNCFRRETID